MAMPNFALASTEAPDDLDVDEYPFEFKLGGKEYAARMPTKSEIVLFLGFGSVNESQAAQQMLRLLSAILDDDSFEDIIGRARDPKDPLEIDDMSQVIEWLIEERTANPTSSPSGSSAGRAKSGSSSTAGSRPKASTRSRSARAGS